MRQFAVFVALAFATFVPRAGGAEGFVSQPDAPIGFISVPAAPSFDPAGALRDALVEQVREHVVARGEWLGLLAARYGVSVSLIAERNALDPRQPILVGQRLAIVSRHVVPPAIDDGIVVNVPQRMVFRFEAGRVLSAYPATVGRRNWTTPTGDFTVINRQIDKTWIVPPSIQAEMLREGKPVLTEVPPGPDNPLGRHWIGTSLPGIGLHGTNAPASVYGFRSHGCVRLHPDDIAALFARTRVGDAGRIVYRPLLLAQAADGRIWFEANPDAYRRGPGSIDTVREMARLQSIDERAIDWSMVEQALKRREGNAVDVGALQATEETGRKPGSDHDFVPKSWSDPGFLGFLPVF